MFGARMLRLSFLTALVLALFHVIASALYLYSYYSWWIDIPPHFLGGLAVGFFVLWLSASNFWKKETSAGGFSRSLWAVMAGVLLVGIVWEVFEYFAGLTFNALGNYPLDAAKDLLMDIAGALSSYLFFTHGKGENCVLE